MKPQLEQNERPAVSEQPACRLCGKVKLSCLAEFIPASVLKFLGAKRQKILALLTSRGTIDNQYPSRKRLWISCEIHYARFGINSRIQLMSSAI